MLIALPLHFISIEHIFLEEKLGPELGKRVGEVLGYISGWGFFIGWIIIWFAPQPRFLLNPFGIVIMIPFLRIITSLLHLVIFAIFFTLGFYFGVKGVMDLGLRVSETHRPERVVTSGIYSMVRHPQYLGGFLAHIGLSFLLSARYSLLLTPLIALILYLMAWKEEKELIREFGAEYEEYKKRVPMFIPKIRL